MKIAVITGASSGMGKAFTKQIDEKYQELDEIWVIARKKEGLEGLKKEISKLRILPMDLTDRQALEEFSTLLKREAVYSNFGGKCGNGNSEKNRRYCCGRPA